MRWFAGSGNPAYIAFMFDTVGAGLAADKPERQAEACAQYCLDNEACVGFQLTEDGVCRGYNQFGSSISAPTDASVMGFVRVSLDTDAVEAGVEETLSSSVSFSTLHVPVMRTFELFDLPQPAARSLVAAHQDNCLALCEALKNMCQGVALLAVVDGGDRCVGVKDIGFAGGAPLPEAVVNFKKVVALFQPLPTTEEPTTEEPTTTTTTQEPTTTEPATGTPVLCDRIELVEGGGACRCASGCYTCMVDSLDTSKHLTCEVCAKGLFLNEAGECVEAGECPAGTYPTGSKNRGNACVALPFTCDAAQVIKDGTVLNSPSCDCSAGTMVCDFDAASVETARVCRDNTVLEGGACVASCSEGLIVYGDGSQGLECHPPVESCIHFVDRLPNGDRCRCDAFGDACKQCRNGPSAACLLCGEGQFLDTETGFCVEECPPGFVGLNADGGLRGGECVRQDQIPDPVQCRHWSIIESTGERCRCPNDCIECRLGGGLPDICLTCGSGKPLVDGACADECPSGQVLLGDGNWGRYCGAPVACQHWVDFIEGPNGVSERCICPSNCRQCVLGGASDQCTQCKAGKFLHNGVCINSCPAGTTAFIPAGNWGRECI